MWSLASLTIILSKWPSKYLKKLKSMLFAMRYKSGQNCSKIKQVVSIVKKLDILHQWASEIILRKTDFFWKSQELASVDNYSVLQQATGISKCLLQKVTWLDPWWAVKMGQAECDVNVK